MSAGSSWLDKLILLIDEGDYTHTTQYIGKVGNQHMVVEATTRGIVYESTDPDMTQDLVDAYRYVSPDGHQFGDPGWPVDPVLDVAKSFVGGQYAYSELLLAAVAILASEMPNEQNLSIIVRLALDFFEHEFELWLNENATKTPMTCVQVATAAHWNAASDPANKYGLQVVLNDSRKPPISSDQSTQDMVQYQAMRSRIISRVSSLYSVPGVTRSQQSGLTVFAGSDLLPLGSCTPRDMETSPTLQFIGCIQDNRTS
ncbi:hypothetical protein [Spirosoma rhododendri]|uniref:Uncharacterized protein n=1 Tax=Spirosoma rhododendri TaxID=2728024 RepID=A0A7L5DPU4_9BACT|nr:hypothetical protein [Spirosoma rhododendri]QJD79602.1 hypothetical protein HH216_15135 [Spirosoma rhododendri]